MTWRRKVGVSRRHWWNKQETQNKIVLFFNSASSDFLLIWGSLNLQTIPKVYNNQISLQSNSIFQINLNMVYNHALNHLYMIHTSHIVCPCSLTSLCSVTHPGSIFSFLAHTSIPWCDHIISHSSSLRILAIQLVHQTLTSLEDFSRIQDILHYEWCLQLESQGWTARFIDNMNSKNTWCFFSLHTHTHTLECLTEYSCITRRFISHL